MHRLATALLLTSIAAPLTAQAQLATRKSAAAALPAGDYECKMGSYAFRACQVVAEGEGVAVVIPDGLGHFMAVRAEILPSDTAREMTFQGRLTNPGAICPRCPDEQMGKPDGECKESLADKQACVAQPLLARLRLQKDRAWKGELTYFILRPSYDKGPSGLEYKGYFKLGNTIDLTIRPKKK